MATDIQAVTDYRGSLVQGTTTTLKLRLTNFQGDAESPESLTIQIFDEDGVAVLSSTGAPEQITKGFFIWDWEVSATQPIGPYDVIWTYEIDNDVFEVTQGVIIISDGDDPDLTSPYSQRIADIRSAFEIYLGCTQAIPVVDEQGIICDDQKTVRFNFPRWNQNRGMRIFRNQKRVTGGIKVNYAKGEVEFITPLHDKYDSVNASYSMRWFSDEELDRFLLNSVHKMNNYPPQTPYGLQTVPDKYLPVVMYGAAVDALRTLIMCLQYQEPKEVFGGMEQAKEAASVFETLKQNYEKDAQDLLEVKKLFPYKGLTRVISTPEYTLPGGRSRWFRYLMGGFTLS